MINKLNLLLIATLATFWAHAADNAPAHTHGNANIKAVLTSNELTLSFSSPADNIVGFEHRAQSAQDKATVDAAIEKLRHVNEILEANPDAQCTWHTPKVAADALTPLSDHAHAEHVHEEENHADIEVLYQATCVKPDELKNIKFLIFNVFPNTKEIQLEWVDDQTQKSQLLNKDHNEFTK